MSVVCGVQNVGGRFLAYGVEHNLEDMILLGKD